MKKIKKLMISLIIVLSVLSPIAAYAREGDCGYEGGISAMQATYNSKKKVSFEYKEVCFVSGEPIVFKGTLTIDKSLKKDKLTTKYEYDLENTDKSATLERSLELVTTLTKKDNGQTIEETSLGKKPTETINIGDSTYTIDSFDFTRSNLIDAKPAINYFAGNTWSKKVYQTGTGTESGKVTVEATGSFYGYDQYWGTAEVQTINYLIQSEGTDKWGGSASVVLSSSTTKQLKFIENEPSPISFEGGYLETQYDNSIMEYTCKLPEFDHNGISTDNVVALSGSLKTESFPVQTRLPVPDTSSVRGHWAENDIKMLYSLEILQGDGTDFNPDKYITRAEFTQAFVQAAKEVPPDPALASKTSTSSRTRRNTKDTVVSPFDDVSTESMYFASIESAFKRGLVTGKNGNNFVPNGTITVADAVSIFIRAMGLESRAPGTNAVTTFRDNDEIPEHARNAVYVAEKIGLIKGDDRGYLKPNENLTKARAAVLINRFVKYMREDIRKDYREAIVNF